MRYKVYGNNVVNSDSSQEQFREVVVDSQLRVIHVCSAHPSTYLSTYTTSATELQGCPDEECPVALEHWKLIQSPTERHFLGEIEQPRSCAGQVSGARYCAAQ
jgi:hypothetical protein